MKISNECELGNFSIAEECDCEHCGTLTPFSVTWSDGGTWWCLSCARYDDNFELTEEFKTVLLVLQKKELRKYHEKGLKEIENQEEPF